MTVSLPYRPEPVSTVIPRQRDRRGGIGALLSTLSRGLHDRVDSPTLRRMFEDAVLRLVPARSVVLHGGESASTVRRESEGSEAVVLEVPGVEVSRPKALEVRFDRTSRPGEWDLQLLQLAAQVGGLVLEIERGRCQGPRHVPPVLGRIRPDAAAPLVGHTPAMQALRATIERVADTDFTVLLDGESGAGKELVARQIHAMSRRRGGPFVAINCAALVETLLEAELFGIEERTATGVRGRRGKFENADGGTLFLDEVSDLSLAAQAKLLRAIQDLAVERVGGHGTRRVDIRIVAATNRSLKELVDRHLFRPDLFYRLSGVDVRVPPLRERRNDVIELAMYFLERHRPDRGLRLSTEAADALFAYDWPGNVRELERLIERSVTLVSSNTIQLNDLPPAVRGESTTVLSTAWDARDTLRAWGSRYSRLVLERCRGNKRETCRVLNISYHTLTSLLKYREAANPKHLESRDPEAFMAHG